MQKSQLPMPADLYFDPRYAQLYEEIEGGSAEHFLFDCAYGSVSHTFIKRPIPQLVNGEQYYDLVTPYGYGGPCVCSVNAERETQISEIKEKLLLEFADAFGEYCRNHRIVSEFIRFHPIAENALDFSGIYDILRLRHTVGTDLGSHDDPVQAEFSKSCRKSIRRALNAGVTWKVIEHPEDVSDFIRVYYSTMDRDHAEDFYYFDEAYFRRCLDSFGDQIIMVQAIYENQVIAAGFYFLSGDVIHVHLSGTLQEYLHLSPAYVLKYATAVWGKEHGYRLIHYGGGTSNSEENSLYQFKLKFTQNTLFDFYIGKKIWNQEIYDKLCEGLADTVFFPAYRSH